MPRSGSELLQALLGQHPDVYASPTSPLLDIMYAARGAMLNDEVKAQSPELMSDAFLGFCKGGMMGYYSMITDLPVVVDKSRGWHHYIEWLEQMYAEPKIVCMVRDLRSILCSMERIHRANRHLPSIENPSNGANITLDQRIDYWLNNVPVGISLNRLSDLFQRNRGDSVMFIQYEQLCESPVMVMNKVYEYLKLSPHTIDQNNVERAAQQTDHIFGPYGDHTIRSTVSPSATWETMLTSSMSDAIMTKYDWYTTIHHNSLLAVS